MLIVVKQSFEVRSDSGEKFSARNNDIVVPPEWVIHNKFFKALCDSGKITAHVDSKSIELEQAKDVARSEETKKQGRK